MGQKKQHYVLFKDTIDFYRSKIEYTNFYESMQKVLSKGAIFNNKGYNVEHITYLRDRFVRRKYASSKKVFSFSTNKKDQVIIYKTISEQAYGKGEDIDELIIKTINAMKEIITEEKPNYRLIVK
ncbi:MAG: hypothetical protein ACW96U_00880 [Candidatus Heimdallarchaeaceae archaeon]